MNIKALANKLNLSIATVSRALNNHPEVSAATQKRVREAADLYGYLPNAAGRNLRKGKVNTVALLLPSGDGDNFYTASFFMRVAAGLQAHLRAQDIDTILHLALDEKDEQLWLQKIIEQRKADAVILTNTTLSDPRIEYLTDHAFPFATLGRSHTLAGEFNWVDLDFEHVAEVAIERGQLAGYQNFALVTIGHQSTQGAIFANAWRNALTARGLTVNDDYLFYGEISEASGFEALRHFHALDTPPDYVVFLSDLQLLGASAYSQQHRWHIPFFAGVFSSDMSSFLPTKPTGFEIPYQQLGTELALAVLNAMQEGATPRHSLPELTFVERREHVIR
ncbi:LacI family DNA-binding transcriptional regulator [Kluyvera intermedia]|uniref:LacI family DNA-binding transcriptional regulator n=1 Tax=Kluyvera intermedia TaxID=61648 RepID=UPI00372D60BF